MEHIRPHFHKNSFYLRQPDIDLFANRLNFKITPYVSWHPDPSCITTNAFSIPWNYSLIYCFPPFSLIWKTLAKIRREQVEALLIVPHWPTQSWYPAAMRMLVDLPKIFTSANQNLLLPHKPTQVHPLYPKMKMLVLRLSGKRYKNVDFYQKQKKSCSLPGEIAQKIDTIPHSRDGKSFVLHGVRIPFKHL